MSDLLRQVGGRKVIDQTVYEFYQAVGRHLSDADSRDHDKQATRQSQFLNNALSDEPEPLRCSRASFLAHGLNRPMFEALLEFVEARLVELGFSGDLGSRLVARAKALYGHCEQPLPLVG